MKFTDVYLAVKILFLLLPTNVCTILAYLRTPKPLHPSYPAPLMAIVMARHALAHLILLLTQPGSSFKSILDLAVKACYQTAFSFLPFAGIKSFARGVSLRVTLWSNRTPKIQCPSRKGHFSYCQETVEHIVTDSSLRLRLCSVATQCGSIRT